MFRLTKIQFMIQARYEHSAEKDFPSLLIDLSHIIDLKVTFKCNLRLMKDTLLSNTYKESSKLSFCFILKNLNFEG